MAAQSAGASYFGRIEKAKSHHEINIMKDNAILVNCAGGGMVDEKTLLRALDKKKMGGAALDVIEIEPPTLDVYGEFLKHENVIMTPHIEDIPKENQNRTGSGG